MGSNFKPELIDIFKNINDMTRFGEAKNTGLVALNVGLLISVFVNFPKISPFVYPEVLIIAAILFCSSILSSLFSLFPVTQNLMLDKMRVEDPNLYFFGDLSQIDTETFVANFRKEDPEFTPGKMQVDLINQILINSRIAKSKFKYFKYSLTLTMTGISLIVLAFIAKVLLEGFSIAPRI